MRISNDNVVRILFVAAVMFLCVSILKAQAILQPAQDVLIVTFGGGEGCNVFVKYDITSVPTSMVIDSVFMTPYVVAVGDSWDGDIFLWNVNDQDWTEGDSCNHIYGLPTSNQITQASGFGMTPGWDQSVDLTDIFLVDYNASHTYCSIKIKDPDDMTSVPMPGSMPVNAETLAVGNIIFDEYTIFYAREYPNAPPWLVVYYHSVGINEKEEIPGSAMVTVKPNPMVSHAHITISTKDAKTSMLQIYDSYGSLVKQFTVQENTGRFSTIVWDGTDIQNRAVPAGIYFCVVTGEGFETVEPLCIVR